MRVSGRTTWAALVAGGLLVGCYGDVPSAPSEPVISIGPAALPDPIASPAEPDPTPEVVLDPGRVTIRRLNRAEYDNTVRDLLGVAIAPAADFPSDDHSYGFDNIADVLAMSPVLMELYERAAGRLVAEALRVPLLTMWDSQVLAEEADDVAGLPYDGFGVLMFSPDARVTHTFDVPLDGRYSLSVVAWGQPLADELPIMSVKVDQKEVATAPVAELEEQPGEYVFELDLSEGSRQLSITLANGTVIGAGELLVLGVATLRLTGPVDFVSPPAGWVSPRDRLLVCAPVSDSDADAAACARQILEALASRAWRRPVTDADMTRLMALYEEASEEGLDFEAAVAMALRAVLVSPFFIFRVEVDADPTSLEPHPLNDHELATRLSYFLWSSAPDEELTTLADAGELADPDVIAQQVDRMLGDPRAWALISNFVGQWLYTRHVEDIAPDAWFFPAFDEALRDSMRTETELYLQSFIDDDRSLLELLTADDTFVDDRLADHYGLDPVGPGFHRVDGSEMHRGGLLRQASVLSVTSYPTRTSLVKRGQWVLEQLLCAEVPPPPAGVEGLAQEAIEATSLREVLAQHRADPACSGCHSMMDPIGLGMEHYDGVGAWRELDNGHVIEAEGELADGRTFQGVSELAELLVADDQFVRCVMEQLFVYALGRGPTEADEAHLDLVFERFGAGGWTFRALATAVATSETFRARRGELEEEEGARR